MHELRRSRLLSALLCLALIGGSMPPPLVAGEAAPPTPASQPTEDLTAALDRSRELIKAGDYDKAIEILKSGAIERARSDLGSLRDAYLLLIEAYVYLGNELKFKLQGREASNLNYQEAKQRIAECLRIEGLRHTQPEPVGDYPPEMIGYFAEVRDQIFGSFRVMKLEPPGAVVLLDADTLRALPGGTLLGDVDLPVGAYRVVIRAKGYKGQSEAIVISPNSMVERTYRLPRKHGLAWYATASTAALAAVVGIFAAARGSTSLPPAAEPLPGAPPPPLR